MKIETQNAYGFNGWAKGSRQALESFVYTTDPKLLPKVMRLADQLEKKSPNHTLGFTQTILKLRTRNGMKTEIISAVLPQVFAKRNTADKFVPVIPKGSNSADIRSILNALKKYIAADSKAIKQIKKPAK